MKSVFKVVSAVLLVLCCLIALLLGAIISKDALFSEGAAKLQADVAEMEQVSRKAGTDGAFTKEFGKDLERASETAQRLRIYGYGALFVNGLTLLLMAFSFMKRRLPLWIVAGAGMATTLGLVAMIPAEYGDPADFAKSLALFFGLAVVFGLGFVKLDSSQAPAKAFP